MGLFWDLMQQSQLSKQRERSSSLEQKVMYLEADLHKTKKNLHELITLLENKFGMDFDGDGNVG